MAHADDIKGKVGESLRENLDQLELSRKLATIHCDIELELGPSELAPHEADLQTLRALYEHLELRSLLKTLPDEGAPKAAATTAYETILTERQFNAWLKKIKAANLVALDTETTSINYMAAELVGLSFAVADTEAVYLPVAHNYPGAPRQLDRDRVLARLKSWLEDPQQAKVGHHLKYDAHILANHGIDLAGQRFDTMLESYVLNSTAIRHDLDSVARRYLGRETIHYEVVAGKGAADLDATTETDAAGNYLEAPGYFSCKALLRAGGCCRPDRTSPRRSCRFGSEGRLLRRTS